MQRIRSSAIPALVAALFLAGACQDAPLAPLAQRTPAARHATATATPEHNEVFAGAAGDSVMELLETAWASHGRPDYRAARQDWRRRNNVPARVVDAKASTARSASPNADLIDGSYRPPASILSHYATLHLGVTSGSTQVPGGVEGEMTFSADHGEIQLGSLTITRDSGGSAYTTSGPIALGPGELINCVDTVAGCDNTRHLSGVKPLNGAPSCNARGSGTVNYLANYMSAPLGMTSGSIPLSYTGTSPDGSATASASISSTGGTCSTTTGQQGQGDSTTTTPGTGAVGPPPPPTGPGVPTPPPYSSPPVVGGTVELWCEQVDVYQVFGTTRMLLSTSWECYNS